MIDVMVVLTGELLKVGVVVAVDLIVVIVGKVVVEIGQIIIGKLSNYHL